MPSGIYEHKTGYKRAPFSEEWKRKISETMKKSPVRYWTGKKMSLQTREKMSLGRTGKGLGKDNGLWKGDDAKYVAFHTWLTRNFGKANKCENKNCIYPRRSIVGKVLLKNPKRFEWALIKGKKHSHKRENYKQLCASCHRVYDRWQNKEIKL